MYAILLHILSHYPIPHIQPHKSCYIRWHHLMLHGITIYILCQTKPHYYDIILYYIMVYSRILYYRILSCLIFLQPTKITGSVLRALIRTRVRGLGLRVSLGLQVHVFISLLHVRRRAFPCDALPRPKLARRIACPAATTPFL